MYLVEMRGLLGDGFGFEVMACAGVAVREAWWGSSRGEGDEMGRCVGVPVRWMLGAGCCALVAMGVVACVCPGGEVQVMLGVIRLFVGCSVLRVTLGVVGCSSAGGSLRICRICMFA